MDGVEDARRSFDTHLKPRYSALLLQEVQRGVKGKG